ncbi:MULTISPECIES: FKBP-type peptidyl-prolyl cis-trans isomerase [unclassified Lentimicrobium]|uniref:FKBP-type peptidyl-prolyl cis-trans isomerase n=1 Tax=unclassified Lentimicrobium TaxID=2677434 RepID=UPI00155734D0|nr:MULTISPECIES: FKBP-type peptidyl-prolyl cis-trans isomerase [unclassified Lentimicrobium]NPD45427.1 FKBP-type peptidyl-prolyl cis-trans isomerase [Lentimicrobium sp. S6]NPD83789.1 FKBP-type peptidyl-prolyl cis-trans isomerase [Lentimicrobium sp. L6]
MERRIIGLFTIVTLVFFSCNRGEYASYDKADSGLLYKIHEDKGSTKAKSGDYLTVEMTYFTNEDSLLFDAQGQTFPMRLEEPVFAGDINEALSLMGIGDSATFVIRADSFLMMNAKLTQLPKFVTEESKVVFHVKLHDIQTLEQLEMQEAKKREQARDAEAKTIEKYIKDNNISQEPTSTGLYFLPTKSSTGKKPRAGQTVKVHYTGKFLDGRVFDSSVSRGKPIEFKIGYGQVINGWDEGISMMRKGEEATFIIPSYLGYGEGRGEIPPYTTLLFDVKLIDIK